VYLDVQAEVWETWIFGCLRQYMATHGHHYMMMISWNCYAFNLRQHVIYILDSTKPGKTDEVQPDTVNTTGLSHAGSSYAEMLRIVLY
jgi:hypothetical protein